jgi:hypothetical protein
VNESNRANTSAHEARDSSQDHGAAGKDLSAYVSAAIRLVIMAGAMSALIYQWKPEYAPLLLIVVGFFTGFLVMSLRGSAPKRK